MYHFPQNHIQIYNHNTYQQQPQQQQQCTVLQNTSEYMNTSIPDNRCVNDCLQNFLAATELEPVQPPTRLHEPEPAPDRKPSPDYKPLLDLKPTVTEVKPPEQKSASPESEPQEEAAKEDKEESNKSAKCTKDRKAKGPKKEKKKGPVDTSSYTIEERLLAAVWVHERKVNDSSISEIRRKFRKRFKKDPPAKATLLVWERKLFTSGSICDSPRSGRPSKRAEHREIIMASLASNPSLSMRARARAVGLPRSTLRLVLQSELGPAAYEKICLKDHSKNKNKEKKDAPPAAPRRKKAAPPPPAPPAPLPPPPAPYPAHLHAHTHPHARHYVSVMPPHQYL